MGCSKESSLTRLSTRLTLTDPNSAKGMGEGDLERDDLGDVCRDVCCDV